MGSLSLIIVLILVVWVIVLAPMLSGGVKKIRRSGEGYEETRVLHEGGTEPVVSRRRPKLTAADVHQHAESEDDVELVEAEEEQVLIDDAPPLRTIFRKDVAAREERPLVIDADAAEDAEGIKGVKDTADADDAGDATDSGSTRVTVHTDAERDDAREPRDADADADDAEDTAENATDSSQINFADKEYEEYSHYELRDTYESPSDFGYVDADAASATVIEHDDEHDENHAGDHVGDDAAEPAAEGAGEVQSHADESHRAESGADSLEPDESDIAFAKTRRGRGGYDPERERAARAERFRRRQRTFLGLIVFFVATFVIAFVAGGWTWVLPVVAVGLNAWFLVAAHSAVRKERALHQRRVRQLRRARMGVDMERHPQPDSRERRRVGSVILDLDEEHPDFDALPSYQRNTARNEDGEDYGDYTPRAS